MTSVWLELARVIVQVEQSQAAANTPENEELDAFNVELGEVGGVSRRFPPRS